MPPPKPAPTPKPADAASKANVITPANDPELIFVVDKLKELKNRGFYGSVVLKLEAGCVMRYTLEESVQLPVAARLPSIELRQGT